MKNSAAFIMTLMLISGCCVSDEKYVDVSNEPRFRQIISSGQIINSDVWMLGIDSCPPERHIKYYELVPLPGFDGPEVLSRVLLHRGASIAVIRAESCTNCGARSERLLVEVGGFTKEQPIYLDASFVDILE
jgi:hypothetical protein